MLPIDRIIDKLYDARVVHKPKYTPNDKDLALINKSPKAIYYYACNFLKKPYEKGEKVLAKNSRYAMFYLSGFRKKLTQDRINLLENAISKNTQSSYEYAYGYGKRFEKGEKAISKDSDLSLSYAMNVIKGRFELGEDAISKNAEDSLTYAKEVIKGRFEKCENIIAKDSDRSIVYAEIIKQRFPKGEKVIKKDGLWGEYMDTIADSIIRKSENKRIADKEIEKYALGYSSYERLIKNSIIDNIHDGSEIIEEYSDLPFFDKLITAISRQHGIPTEVNNYMIAKGLVNGKSSKAYLKNQSLFKQKIKNFLKQHSGKTVDELILCM